MHPDPNPQEAPTASAQPHVAARDAILGRTATFREQLVLVDGWVSDALPVVERERPDGSTERGNVLCIELDADRRAQLLDESIVDGEVRLRRMYPEMVIAGAHHPENRQPLFTAMDRDALKREPGSGVETIATAVGKLSGMDKNAAKAAAGE